MVSEKMKPFMANNSAIRAMFEEGKKMAAVYGAENVYDFSLGNPNVPVPEVNEAILEIVKEEAFNALHGYMSNAGFEDVRQTIAQSINERFGTSFSEKNLIMTVGAASGLNVILKSILNPGDQVIVFAPYFVEYDGYVRNYDGEVVRISPDTETFMPKLDEFEEKITKRTKAVIINNPNNPTGVVYGEDTIKALAAILEKKEKEFGISILLISDEPYREIVFSGFQVPWIPQLYPDTIVCYSFSKSLSLPGERLGYVLVPGDIPDSADVYAAVAGAGRSLGYVNAPSLFQQVTSLCCDMTADLSVYERNCKLLVPALREMGYHCVEPGGAFYLFPRSLEPDDMAFSERAKQFDLLLVPGSGFGAPGHVRIAYCVQTEMIQRALPKFKALADSYL